MVEWAEGARAYRSATASGARLTRLPVKRETACETYMFLIIKRGKAHLVIRDLWNNSYPFQLFSENYRFGCFRRGRAPVATGSAFLGDHESARRLLDPTKSIRPSHCLSHRIFPPQHLRYQWWPVKSEALREAKWLILHYYVALVFPHNKIRFGFHSGCPADRPQLARLCIGR